MNIILLSGGSGKRLWPLSNDIRSKQFIKIFKREDGKYESMVQRVYRQIKAVAKETKVIIATSKSQVSSIQNQLGFDVPICLEPCRRDTFPAIALASAYLVDVLKISPSEAVVVCPVDPYVDDSYFEKLKDLVAEAERGKANLVLMGIEPTYPSEKYGYIIPETKEEISPVREFKEKPTVTVAEEYIKQGALWNGGVFAFKLSYLLAKAHELIDFTDYDDLFKKYDTLKKISFDYAVVEHEKSISVVKYSGQWKDLGTWNTLTEAMNEHIVGKGVMDDKSTGVHIINELDIPILAMGLHDVVISASPEGILVSDKSESSYIKPYVDKVELQGLCSEKSCSLAKINTESMGKKVIPFSPPDITEEEISAVSNALRSGWITTGPRTKKLERRLTAFLETGKNNLDTEIAFEKWSNRLVCLNSATAAEEMNFRICGIGEGDEVIVPAYTYTSTASATLHTGAKLVMVDSQKDSFEMDYDKLRDAITPRTKAIVAVDLGGIIADYNSIYKVVEEKRKLFVPSGNSELGRRIQKAKGRVLVFADAAHSLGAYENTNKVMAGRIADFSSFSFHAVKNFTTAEGGASTWLPIEGVSDAEIYKQFQLYSLHGQSKDALDKTKLGAWEYDIIGPWFKCGMTDVLAALGLVQLDRYPSLLKRRREIIEVYDKAFRSIGLKTINHFTETSTSSGHLYIVRIPGISVEQRNNIINKMAQRGVATNVHYKPLPMFTAYKELGFDIKAYPNAYDFYHNAITLPLYSKLTDEEVQYIVSNFTSVVSEVRGEI